MQATLFIVFRLQRCVLCWHKNNIRTQGNRHRSLGALEVALHNAVVAFYELSRKDRKRRCLTSYVVRGVGERRKKRVEIAKKRCNEVFNVHRQITKHCRKVTPSTRCWVTSLDSVDVLNKKLFKGCWALPTFGGSAVVKVFLQCLFGWALGLLNGEYTW